MHRSLVLMLGIAVLSVGPAFAQAANPILEHYRAYNAAMQRGDLSAAEAEAAAALAASEARDGAGGRTAVLAANLAQVRLDQGHPDTALAPAQRALALAEQSGTQAGVDPVYARLLAGRAELSGAGDNVAARLQTAIPAAEAAGGFGVNVHDAALALGNWAMRQHKYDIAAQAFEAAVRTSSNDGDVGTLDRADAQTGLAVALMEVQRMTRARTTGTHLVVHPGDEPLTALADAVRLTLPLVQRDARGGPPTRAERVYGNALAWLNAFASRSRSLDYPNPLTAEQRGGVSISLSSNLPGCEVHMIIDPQPVYPQAAIDAAGVGSVVARFVTNESGVITDASVVGVAGGEGFANAVRAAMGHWRFPQPNPGSPPCSLAGVYFVPVTFQISG